MADAGAPGAVACDLYNIATDGLDIRAEEVVDADITNSAWAWGAGVVLDDLTVVEEPVEEPEEPAEEDEEDEEDGEDMSVRMTASAVAAASIAILAM